MIRNTLLTTGGLLLAYSLFIYVFHSSIRRTAQTVEQRNQVIAEEFLYEDGQFADSIIVGSSMSKRLIADQLGGNYYNLSLEGMAAIDGLQLIARAKHRARLILVELNTLDRKPDSSFSAKLNESGLIPLRQYLPFMRLKYQPAGVVKALLRDYYLGPMQDLDQHLDTAFATKLIQERLDHIIDIPIDSNYRNTINRAGVYIRKFRQEGTRIVFFEMPTDPRIRNTKVYSRLRQLTTEAFPNYQFVPFPKEFYQTTDGVHLPRVECIRYSRYLARQLKKIPASGSLAQTNSVPTE